jgi:hypothetical protein
MKLTLSAIETRLQRLETATHYAKPRPTRETILSIALNERLSPEQAARQIGSIGGRVLSASVVRIRELFALARQRRNEHEAHTR